MSDARPLRRFQELLPENQYRFRDFGRQIVRLAQSYAVPIIFAPPPVSGGLINGATGSMLRINRRYFVVTASHVLAGYEKRLDSGEKLNWQVGSLPPIDPLSRIAWRNCARDALLLRLSEDEAHGVGSVIMPAPKEWPPDNPTEGQVVLVSGYPKALREVVPGGIIGADYLTAMFRVTDVRDDTFNSQIGKEEDFVNFNGLSIPDEDMDMGGLSGSPTLIIEGTSIKYLVLVGIVSEYISKSFDGLKLLRIASLASAHGITA